MDRSAAKGIAMLSLMTIAVLFGGCSGVGSGTVSTPDAQKQVADESIPREALEAAFDRMMKSPGYHFEGKRQTEFQMAMGGRGMRSETPFKGVTKNDGKDEPLTRMTYETGGMGPKQKCEVFQQGDRRYARNLTSSQVIDPQDTMRQVPTPLALIRPVIATLEVHKATGEEKISDSDCLVIAAAISSTGAEHIVSLQPTMMPLPSANRTFPEAVFKMWVDKKDKTVRRITLFVDSSTVIKEPGGERSVQTSRKIWLEVNILDYGKDVEIELPDGAKEALKPNQGH